MANSVNKLVDYMTRIRNTKIFNAFVDASGSAFKLIFCLSGVLFVNSLLPDQFKISLLYEYKSFILALVPLFIAYYFGKSLYDVNVGVMAVIVTGYTFGLSVVGYNVVAAFIVTLIVWLFFVIIDVTIKKVKFPQAIPSMVHGVAKEWIVNVITLSVVLLIISLTKQLAAVKVLSMWILAIGISPIYYLASIVLMGVFWTFGFHGDRLVGPFLETFLFTALYQNLIGVNPSIINSSFHIVFATGSGSGMTMSLIIAILVASKVKETRQIAKDNIVSGFFNINEGIVFGIPVVDNKILTIPFVIVPVANAIYGYLMNYFGVIKPFIYAVPWITPPLLKSFIASGGQLYPVFVELGAYILGALIYLPFIIKSEEVVSDEL